MNNPTDGLHDNKNGKLPGGVTGKGFMPGHSGNPKGRVKRAALLGEIIRAHADRINPNDKQGLTNLESLVEELYEKDPKTYLAYGFGKPVEPRELSGAEGQPVEFRIALKESELP